MILVYVAEQSERLKYTFDFIFNEVIKIPYELTNKRDEFVNSDLTKFSYGKEPVESFLFFRAHSLLFEKDISKQKIEFKEWRGLPVFFSVEKGELPFDLFACTFFLITRYEEYLSMGKDHHQRFKSEESTSYKGGFLERPVVNLWLEEFKKILNDKFPSLSFPAPVFTFTPTIDIDNAYAYKYKGFSRSFLGLLQKLMSFQMKKFSERFLVHAGFKKDPYDSYEKIFNIHKAYKVKPLIFILLGDYGKYDKNLSHNNRNYVKLIRSLRDFAIIGLHPSYKSNEGNGQLAKEKQRLEEILEMQVTRSRQHYIRLEFPKTYRALLEQGIKEDYSMGFPSKAGFRAGTSTPFYFFDVERNQATGLKIFPFAIMDSTLKYYLRYRSKEVIPFVEPMIKEMKRVGGNFVFVFHNESLGESKMWKNWGDIYEKMIRLSQA